MSFFMTSDGLTLAYRDQGTGAPLLCLAGLTRNSADFEAMANLLPDVRIIRQDYRGRGRSDRDPDFRNYNPMTEARDAVELLDHLGLKSVPILGTSRGGIVAMVIAATRKDRISGVILNDIGPVIERTGLDRIAEYLGRQPSAGTLEEAARDTAASSVGFRNVPHERWIEECRCRYDFEDGRPRLNYDPKLRDAVLPTFAAEAPDLWPYFDALEGIPVGLIRGANSDLLSVATVEKMRSRRPDIAVLNVPDRGHCPFLDEPECIAFIRHLLTQDGRST